MTKATKPPVKHCQHCGRRLKTVPDSITYRLEACTYCMKERPEYRTILNLRNAALQTKYRRTHSKKK